MHQSDFATYIINSETCYKAIVDDDQAARWTINNYQQVFGLSFCLTTHQPLSVILCYHAKKGENPENRRKMDRRDSVEKRNVWGKMNDTAETFEILIYPLPHLLHVHQTLSGIYCRSERIDFLNLHHSLG